MQLLIDFLPVIVFFLAYKLKGIYVATAAIMTAMTVQVAAQWLIKRKVSNMLLISWALVVLFGAITLGLRNPLFIKWKLTVVDGLFATAFLVSQFVGKKTLVEHVMGHAIDLPAATWRQLNLMWVANFAFLSVANVYIIYNFSEEFWVNFKVWGTLGFTLLIVLIQGIWIARALPPESKKEHS